MSRSIIELLCDENEIRAALRPLRPDISVFGSGVRKRLEVATNHLNDVRRSNASEINDPRKNDWLRIASSFAPLHLLSSNFESKIAPISFATISLGKKLAVILAFPFLCFFMVGLTVIGLLRIRAAQNGQVAADFDIEQARQATSRWWKRYGWLAAVVFVVTLISPFWGWTTPLMIALVCSGFAAVSFVRTLAKENLVERSLIGGSCVAALGLLGQLSQSFSSHSAQVLDPNLVTGVLFAGAFTIGSIIRPLTWSRSSMRLQAAGSLLIVGLIMTVCTQSYWRGVTESHIQAHVESFDGSQLGSWEDWADAAKWLNETGNGFDKQVVAQHFRQDLDKKPQMREWMLTAAVRARLIPESEMLSFAELEADRKQLTDPQFLAQSIFNLKGDYFRVAAVAADRDLSAAERGVLANRLLVNWSQLDSSDFDYDRLKSALLLTELLCRLDRSDQLEQRTADVHRWFVSHQITEPSPFRSGGGFSITQQVPDSDRRATLAAISLMETYGVPAELDLPQLRSYLRPNFLYDFTAYDFVPKKVAREKLNHLSGVTPLTMMDYLRTDLPLWLSILLVLLLAYATVSSPVRLAPNSIRSASPARPEAN